MTLIVLYILGGIVGGAAATVIAARMSKRVRDALIGPQLGGGPSPVK